MPAVKMYTTAVCPYCIRAKQILKAKGVEQIEEIRIDTDAAQRDQMMQCLLLHRHHRFRLRLRLHQLLLNRCTGLRRHHRLQ